jgi:branched-chain amino acid transport system permease protein
MRDFVQAVIIGILTGGVYALMASGQTLIFGIMKVINLAQGALVIVGAFLSYSLFVHFGIDPFLSILITTPLLFGIGVLIQLAFLRPLRSDDAAEMSLLVTFAVALGIEGVLTLTYKTNYKSIQTSYANKSFLRLVAGRTCPSVCGARTYEVRARDPRDRSEPDIGSAAWS